MSPVIKQVSQIYMVRTLLPSYPHHSLRFTCTVKGVLTSVSLKNTELTIESRDCISRPEDYSIVVTINNTKTKVVNISFNATVEYTLKDDQATSLIRVEIVHTPSNTTIDEWDPVIMYSPPTPGTDPGYCLYITFIVL